MFEMLFDSSCGCVLCVLLPACTLVAAHLSVSCGLSKGESGQAREELWSLEPSNDGGEGAAHRCLIYNNNQQRRLLVSTSSLMPA